MEALKDFFSVLPEEQRPRIVSDKENPAVWDHPSDKDQIIVTDEPRVDTDAKEISIDGKQVDEVVKQMHPDEEIHSEDPTFEAPEAPPEVEKVRGPMTYADRGFKVGRLI